MWHCNWANLARSHQFLLCQTNLLLCLYFEVLLRMQFTLWDWPRHSGTPFSFWGYHGLSCLYVACGINGPTVLEFTEFIFFVWNVARPNRWCGTTSLRWTWHLWCSSWCGQQGSKHHNCHWHMIHIIQLCSGTFKKKNQWTLCQTFRHYNVLLRWQPCGSQKITQPSAACPCRQRQRDGELKIQRERTQMLTL